MLIAELMSYIGEFAPLTQAADWDNVGLLVGDSRCDIKKALISLDVTPNAVRKAINSGADLILSHHPLIFKPIRQVTDPLLLKLIENQISVICLHTNLDVAPQGVNHALADALGLQAMEHLSAESGGKWFHLSVSVPSGYTDEVSKAVFQAGGGKIGNYASCSSRHDTMGTFQPLDGAKPFKNNPDFSGISSVEEQELEFMVDEADLQGVVAAIKASHPYETPLLYYFPVSSANPAYGLGLVGKLDSTLNLKEIVTLVSERLSCPFPKLWTAGLDPDTKVEKVAICGGAGASILKRAERCADIVITGDIGYHNLLESRIPIIDAGHFYTEYPVLRYLQNRLELRGIPCEVLTMQEHEYTQNLREQL